jgi:PAS domain S-box-containing protein
MADVRSLLNLPLSEIEKMLNQLLQAISEVGQGNYEYNLALDSSSGLGQKFEVQFKQMLDRFKSDIHVGKRIEEELRTSEHRLKVILDSLPAGVVTIDAETREIVEANPAALQMIGAPQDEVLGSICHQFICPAEQGQCPVCDLGQKVENSEQILLTAQGEIVPIIKNVITATIGDRECLIESFVDITQSRQAEKDLRESEEHYRLFLDASPSPIVMYDIVERITYANPAFVETFGWSAEELIGERLDFVPPAYLLEAKEVSLQVLKESEIKPFETKRLTKSGQELDVEMSSVSYNDKDGNFAGSIIFLRDITKFKQVEQEIRASELEARAFFESSADAMMILDEEGFIDCNEAALKLFGYTSKGQFINTHPSEHLPPVQPDDRDSLTVINEQMSTAYRRGAHRFEWIHRRADGSLFPAEVLLTAVTAKGKPVLQAVIRDITEAKAAQDAIERRVERERTIREITDKMQTAVSLEELVKTVTQELSQRFSAEYVLVDLGTETEFIEELSSEV